MGLCGDVKKTRFESGGKSLIGMKIIPTINCGDFACVAEKLKKVADFGIEWVQIDIAD